MSYKMYPKIILEGTRLTFKVEIAFALKEHLHFVGLRKYCYRLPLISERGLSHLTHDFSSSLNRKTDRILASPTFTL